ncbi:aromatic ring-hydroxylating dioxygenase subunit alpha [Paraburkholderia sediminicola]|uniref:Rieske 2Fe-2S domain-containing protein n=1 Tax=Paraburkholderia sediminicola TaxID=458836 RepID=UPI0038B72A8B
MEILKNEWYVAAWSDEVTGTVLARTIANEPVVFFRNAEGKVSALVDRCCHRGLPLSLGKVVPEGLQCGYHGLVFNGAGKCIEIPGQKQIPARACVKSYVVHEKDQLVWIWIGEPEQADTALILDYGFHNDPKNWPHKHGMLPLKGNYMLVIDNLMDLTHIGYVHKNTIGSGTATAHVEAIMETERTPRGVKYARWMLDHDPPLTYSKAVKFDGNVDRWQEFEFVAPGSIVQFSGATNANTGAYDRREREGGFALRIFHGITPETDGSCFYFYSAANGYRQDEPIATEELFDEITRTFLEDKLLVEQQQARLDQLPQPPLLDVVSDGARVAARRYMGTRLKQEEEARSKAADKPKAVLREN